MGDHKYESKTSISLFSIDHEILETQTKKLKKMIKK